MKKLQDKIPLSEMMPDASTKLSPTTAHFHSIRFSGSKPSYTDVHTSSSTAFIVQVLSTIIKQKGQTPKLQKKHNSKSKRPSQQTNKSKTH